MSSQAVTVYESFVFMSNNFFYNPELFQVSNIYQTFLTFEF